MYDRLTQYKNTGSHHRGFTLIELLVVLVIISVILSITTLSIHSADRDPAETALQRLRYDVEILSNEAVIRSAIFGLSFNEQGYSFFIFNDDEEAWQAIEGDNLLTPRLLDKSLQTELIVEPAPFNIDSPLPEESSEGATAAPQVLVFPTGEVTPFSYKVRFAKDEPQTLSINSMGQVQTEEATDDAS